MLNSYLICIFAENHKSKELLEMDYEKTKSFLEYMSNGIEFDNFEPTQQNEAPAC